MGFEPTRALLPDRFSYYTCFYTSQLKLSCCSLDHFFTMREMLQLTKNSNFSFRYLLYGLYAIYKLV